jgi:hypothetical protein
VSGSSYNSPVRRKCADLKGGLMQKVRRSRPEGTDGASRRPPLVGFARGRRSLVVVALGASCAVLLANAARAEIAPTGTRINLFAGTSQTFPADQPFHVSHGWESLPSSDQSVGIWRFSLTVDGVAVRPTFFEMIIIDDPVLGTLLFRP